MFEPPAKKDIDAALSILMHEARRRTLDEKNRITSDAIKAGALGGNRVIVIVADEADNAHKASIDAARQILLDFVQRMNLPATQISEWARPHLENLSNSVLSVIPPNNFPDDYQRVVEQYKAIFQQRVDLALRDVEIGYAKGSGFAAQPTASEKEWITAAEALARVREIGSLAAAPRTICARAHAGMVRARAERFMIGERVFDNYEIPKEFWWAEGEAALQQNWGTGDFETWIKQEIRMRAFSVSFYRADIQKLVPEREAMAAKKRPGNARNLSELAGRILQELREDFTSKGLSSRELTEHYVGVGFDELQNKYCTEGGESQVDFDLAVKELEDALFVDTGPLVPYDNKPGSGIFIMSLFSQREYAYLTEAGYRAASQMINQKPRSVPSTHVHISGGTFHQSQIGIGDQITQMQRVDIDKGVVDALAALTQAISSDHSLPSSEREALLEQISYLNEQAARPAKERKPGMIKATLGAVSQAATAITSVATAWETAGPLLKQYFGF